MQFVNLMRRSSATAMLSLGYNNVSPILRSNHATDPDGEVLFAWTEKAERPSCDKQVFAPRPKQAHLHTHVLNYRLEYGVLVHITK